MLTTFTIRCTFNKLSASMHVDCERREATCTLTYDRRLLRSGLGTGWPVRFDDVSTPDKALAWFSVETPDCREEGAVIGRLEAFELDARRQPLSLMGPQAA